MSSFGAMSQFRTGYWLGIRNFLLHEKRDVAKRIAVINTELDRIGTIRVQYKQSKNTTTGKIEVSEHRTGFFVSKGSSLEKLIQAYLVIGGNPFDISPFFMPDETEVVSQNGETFLNHNYPHGGVVAPETKEFNEPVGTYHEYQGGFPGVKKYVGNRLGNRDQPNTNTDATVELIVNARKFANQEIKEKRQELEHRIIKLADLREQLQQERDLILQQAVGGSLFEISELDTERFALSLHLQQIISTMDKVFFRTDSSGVVSSFTEDVEKIASFEGLYGDVEEEIFLTLMS